MKSIQAYTQLILSISRYERMYWIRNGWPITYPWHWQLDHTYINLLEKLLYTIKFHWDKNVIENIRPISFAIFHLYILNQILMQRLIQCNFYILFIRKYLLILSLENIPKNILQQRINFICNVLIVKKVNASKTYLPSSETTWMRYPILLKEALISII